MGNFAIDCAGSLLSNDLGAFGGRSEVQVDGRNAYDPASAQALFAAASGHAASQNLPGFPTGLTGNVTWDPTTGLLTSTSDESWVDLQRPERAGPDVRHLPELHQLGGQAPARRSRRATAAGW